jgi:hypothetical protein
MSRVGRISRRGLGLMRFGPYPSSRHLSALRRRGKSWVDDVLRREKSAPGRNATKTYFSRKSENGSKHFVIREPSNFVSNHDETQNGALRCPGRRNFASFAVAGKDVDDPLSFFILWRSLMTKIEVEGKCCHDHSNHELKVNAVILIQIIKRVGAFF